MTTLLVRLPSQPEALATNLDVKGVVRVIWRHMFMLLVLSVITGGEPTVNVALCEALPQVPSSLLPLCDCQNSASQSAR